MRTEAQLRDLLAAMSQRAADSKPSQDNLAASIDYAFQVGTVAVLEFALEIPNDNTAAMERLLARHQAAQAESLPKS